MFLPHSWCEDQMSSYKNCLAIRYCFVSFPTLSLWACLPGRWSWPRQWALRSDWTACLPGFIQSLLSRVLHLCMPYFCRSPSITHFLIIEIFIDALYVPGSIPGQGMDCPHRIFYRVVLESLIQIPVWPFLQLSFSAVTRSFLPSARPHLAPP